MKLLVLQAELSKHQEKADIKVQLLVKQQFITLNRISVFSELEEVKEARILER